MGGHTSGMVLAQVSRRDPATWEVYDVLFAWCIADGLGEADARHLADELTRLGGDHVRV